MRKTAVIICVVGVLISVVDATYTVFKGAAIVPTRLAACVPFLLALAAFKFPSARWLSVVAIGMNGLWAFIGFWVLFFGVLFGEGAPSSLPFWFVIAVPVFWCFLPGIININALRSLKRKDDLRFRL